MSEPTVPQRPAEGVAEQPTSELPAAEPAPPTAATPPADAAPAADPAPSKSSADPAPAAPEPGPAAAPVGPGGHHGPPPPGFGPPGYGPGPAGYGPPPPWRRRGKRWIPAILIGVVGLLLGCVIGGTVVGVAAHIANRHGGISRDDGPGFNRNGRKMGPGGGFNNRQPDRPVAPVNPVPSPSTS
jgi:hypothetical protein